MSRSCDHEVGDTIVGSEGTRQCGACERETRKIQEERAAILTLIEETVRAWKDGGEAHPMIEVILARIRARP